MYTAWLQLLDTLTFQKPHYFLVFYAFVMFKWLFINRLAARYRPFKAGLAPDGEPWGRPEWTVPYKDRPTNFEKLRVSFIVPVVNEPEELFRLVLSTLEKQIDRELDEIIVIINGPRNLKLEAICNDRQFKGVIRWKHRLQPGKRGAVIEGLKMSQGNIIGLLDSDTVTRPGAVSEMLKPFGWYSDRETGAKIGGVTTFQTIYRRNEGGMLRRFADWMEDVRAGEYGSMRAMSVLGIVGCLPGRMIALRRVILEESEDEFLGQNGKGHFWGFFNSVSDDRTLTNEALKRGYKTVLQSTARVQTDAPPDLPTFWKQQLRWSRGSQYNTMRMFWHMVRHPRLWPLLFVYSADIIVPFWWFGTLANTLWKTLVRTPEYYGSAPWYWQVPLVVGGTLLSALLRNYPHLKRYPQDVLFLPVYVVLLSLLLTPIRVIGFFQMARDAGWGTRAGANTAVRTRNFKRVYPYVIGVPVFVGLCVAGPVMETPDLFWWHVRNRELELIALAVSVLVLHWLWGPLMRLVKYLSPLWRLLERVLWRPVRFAAQLLRSVLLYVLWYPLWWILMSLRRLLPQRAQRKHRQD